MDCLTHIRGAFGWRVIDSTQDARFPGALAFMTTKGSYVNLVLADATDLTRVARATFAPKDIIALRDALVELYPLEAKEPKVRYEVNSGFGEWRVIEVTTKLKVTEDRLVIGRFSHKENAEKALTAFA